ncbi:hypothetical protein N410_01070 [Helicobacter pylori GC26]|nr:hypothetical protein N410_01070 [Helicobacter pylori GC26]
MGYFLAWVSLATSFCSFLRWFSNNNTFAVMV